MVLLVTAVLFGLGFAYLATQNAAGVTLQAGDIIFFDVPLYLVVLGALFFGFFISWILSGVRWISSALTMHGKDSKIREVEAERDELKKKLQELALENSRLEEENRYVKEEDRIDRHDDRSKKSFFEHFDPHPAIS